MPYDPSTDINALTQRVQALEDLVHMHQHTGFDLTQKLSSLSISSPTIVNSATLGDGIGNPGTLTLQRASGYGDTYIRAGLAASDWSNAAANTGFIIGIDDTHNTVKFYFGAPSNYIKYDGTTLSIVGTLTASTINIPDTTTASSFHVDSSGNAWWGANVASGYANANAYVLATGIAHFKTPLIGGTSILYTVNDNGMFSFGDGSDGAATFDGSTAVAGFSRSGSTYTATRDTYFTDATISTGVTVKPSGYRMFGTGTLTMNGTALIQRDGNAGSNGTNAVAGVSHGTGGPGGAALADGYLKGSLVGGAGADGVTGTSNGNNAPATTSASNCLGTASAAATGGDGGYGHSGAPTPGTGATGGTITKSNVKLIANWHLATLLDISSTGSTVKFTPSAQAGGGGSGGASASGPGESGGGGGAGSSGGIVAIYFRNIVIGASASITAKGGKGGNGGNSFGAAGSGGGAGADGGIIVLVYNTLTSSGTTDVSAGAGGTGGTTDDGGTNFGPGVTGGTGTAGVVYQFQISL